MDQPVTVVIANGTNDNTAVARKSHKCAVVSIFVIFVLFSLPILALVMGTGRIWKCSSKTEAPSWLLGFGIIGIICCWFLIVMIIQRIICGGTHDRSFRCGVSVLLTCSFLILAAAWFFVGLSRINFYSARTYPYYVNGENMYCHPLIQQFSTVMKWIAPIYIVISLCFGAGAALSLSAD